MSLDKSLRSHGALARHRNVLSRAERIEKLADEEKWQDGTSVFGLPKVVHRKVQTKKIKALVAEGEAVPGAEGAVAPAGAAAATAGAPKAAAAPKAGGTPKAGGAKGRA